MRVFIAVIVLIFSLQSWTKADDIRDFQIEGMSIGDSLMDYFSESEINKSRKVKKYKDKTYTTLQFDDFKSENYDYISLSYKTNDKFYIIVGVSGGKYYDKKIKDCYKKQDEIYEDLQELFPNAKLYEVRIRKMTGLKNSTTRQAYLKLKDGSFSGIQCYKYGKEDNLATKRKDVLRVNLFKKKYNYWLVNVAFK